MADRIDIEIALEGGDAVEQQLAQIGQAGQQALGDIQSAADSVDLGSLADQFGAVQKAVQSAGALESVVQGIGRVEGAFDAVGKAAEKMATRMTRSLGVFGVLARGLGPLGIALGVAAGAFLKFGDSAADAINKLTTEGAKLGLTAQQLDVFQKAFGKLGVDPSAVVGGLQKLGEAFGGNLFQGMQRFIEQLERMPDSVQRTQLAINTLGEALGGQVIAGLQTGAITAQKWQDAIKETGAVTQQQVVDAAKYQQAINSMTEAWRRFMAVIGAPIVAPFLENLTKDIQRITEELHVLVLAWELFTAPADKQAAKAKELVAAWNALGKSGAQAGQQTANGMSVANQATQNFISTTNIATGATQQLGQAGAQVGQQYLTGLFNAVETERLLGQQGLISGQNITEGMNQAAQSTKNLEAAAQETLAALRRMGQEAAMWSQAAFGGGIEAQMWGQPNRTGFASGGLIGGQGTGTSDSNLAWVSRGEHIMPARAVGQPGVLAFLEALRRSGGNLTRVLDGMGRFALGGLVSRSIPAFASGGLNAGGSSRTMHLTIGAETFRNLSVPESTALSLERFAVHSQIASTGRKPSWRR